MAGKEFQGVKNPFIDAPEALDDMRKQYDVKERDQYLTKLFEIYKDVGYGDLTENWSIYYPSVVEPSNKLKVELIEEALKTGKRIDEKYFRKDKSGNIY